MTDCERKTVTALFADLKGSTELMESLDPEEASAIVDPALRIMVEAVSRYVGYELMLGAPFKKPCACRVFGWLETDRDKTSNHYASYPFGPGADGQRQNWRCPGLN
jgi:class 3 adenylate cyclase